MKSEPGSQTAYKHNASSSPSVSEAHDHGWTNTINRMIDKRYAFLALQYESDGFLFRGMSAGLFDALLNNKFWHYSGDDSGTNFEKDLDVVLLSQDFSDALTVSKLWQQKLDACIIVFRSGIFNQALANKKAAMMATAEPGVVFKYPFLTQPLNLDDIDFLIISPDLLEAIESKKTINSFSELDDLKFNKITSLISELNVAGKLIIPECGEENYHRSKLEKSLMITLSKLSIVGAKVTNSNFKPKRIK